MQMGKCVYLKTSNQLAFIFYYLFFDPAVKLKTFQSKIKSNFNSTH